jgi:hypothetical protein
MLDAKLMLTLFFMPLPKGLVMNGKPAVHRKLSEAAWLTQNVTSRIQFTGQHSIGYHIQDISGDSGTFDSLNYYGEGSSSLVQSGEATVSGRKVLGVLDFDFHLDSSNFVNPEGERTTLTFQRRAWEFQAGDIQGSLLNDNKFAGFSKNLRGALFGYDSGRFQFRAVRSTVQGEARTISLQGNGSPGPYYLDASEIIPDSEQIVINGQAVPQHQGYTIDYQVGSVTFNYSVPQTSTIVITFEEQAVNSGAGTLQGAGAAYNFGRFGKVGYTGVEQVAPSTAGLSTRADLFEGYGAPSTPYTLTYQPMASQPIIVKLNGQIQTAGIDYRFDAGNPSIFYFLFFVSSTSTIEVDYTPMPTSVASGTRRISGFNYSLPIHGGGVDYSQATGSLTDSATPMSGTARDLSFDYGYKSIKLHTDLEDVPATFVGIQTAGFNRNEKAFDWSLTGGAHAFSYGLSSANDAISSPVAADNGVATIEYGRTTQTDAFAHFNTARGYGLNFDQSYTTSSGAAGDSQVDTTTVAAVKHFGKLATSLNVQQMFGSGLVTNADGSTSEGHLQSQSIGVDSNYAIGRGWSFAGKYSLSDTESTGLTGVGHDADFDLGYHPLKGAFGFDGRFADSRAGTLAALSQFNTGAGFGYNGNGFSDGMNGTGIANGATDLDMLSLMGNLRLSSHASMEAHLVSSESTGSVASNSRNQDIGASVRLDYAHSHTLSLSLDRNLTNYVDGSAPNNASTTLNAYLNGDFSRKWSYNLDVGFLLTNGGDYGQNNTNYSGGILRRLSRRDSLGLNYENSVSTGYEAELNGVWSLSYTRQIMPAVALVGSYNWRRLSYADPATDGIGYRAHGLDVVLTMNFAH